MEQKEFQVQEQDTSADQMRQADELKAARKQFSTLGLMFLAGTLIIMAVQSIPAVIVGMLRPEWMADPNVSMACNMLPQYLVGMPLMILLIKQVPAVKVEKHSIKPGHYILSMLMCYAVMYLSNLAGNIVTFLIGALKGQAVENVAVDMISSLNLGWVFFYTVICAPLYEEYIFRKLIAERTVRYGQAAAVITSGLMFGLFHGNLNQFAYAFTLGAFLAFMYVKTGSLKVTVGLHMLVNFMGGVVGAGLMKLIDMDEYMQVMESMDMNIITEYCMDHIGALLLIMAFGFFVLAVTITGFVLLVVFLAKGRFTFAPGDVTIPRGKRFRTMILNVGMILFCLFWIGIILMQLLA